MTLPDVGEQMLRPVVCSRFVKEKKAEGEIGRRPAGEASSCDLGEPTPVLPCTLESNHSFANDSWSAASGALCPASRSAHLSVVNMLPLDLPEKCPQTKITHTGMQSPVAKSCLGEKPEDTPPKFPSLESCTRGRRCGRTGRQTV